jgi:hypothetical protein
MLILINRLQFIHRTSASNPNQRRRWSEAWGSLAFKIAVRETHGAEFDVVAGKVIPDAREVRTKFSKTFTTWFFPVGNEVRQNVADWVAYLKTEKLFGSGDRLFPATRVVQDQDHQFQAGGLSREHWSNAGPIRAIFKEAFTSAGLAYANPLSFRKTLAQLGERLCHTPEEFKAWSPCESLKRHTCPFLHS